MITRNTNKHNMQKYDNRFYQCTIEYHFVTNFVYECVQCVVFHKFVKLKNNSGIFPDILIQYTKSIRIRNLNINFAVHSSIKQQEYIFYIFSCFFSEALKCKTGFPQIINCICLRNKKESNKHLKGENGMQNRK